MTTAARPLTVVHVTHEATDHIGGIGTVLEGLITSPVYRAGVVRDILVQPLFHAHERPASPVQRLGPNGTACRYSGPDNHDPEGLGAIFRPVEWAFGVRIVYGERRFIAPNNGHEARAELLLVDVNSPNESRLGAFKWQLYERFALDSHRYEHQWDYEEYCRLADPAYHALCALLADDELPCVLISHEYMGMCTALRARLDRRRFRTVFHAHECATARRLIETLPGHDTAFYPAMRRAVEAGRTLTDVFGDQDGYARHALVSRAHHLDGIMAVGDETAAELRFLSPAMRDAPVRVAYNGVPAGHVDAATRAASRRMVDEWAERVLGRRFDVLVTHVTRPVISKALWRDLKLLAHLEPILRRDGRTALYVLLSCGAAPRSAGDVRAMAASHGWPRRHVPGYPDLEGAETALWTQIDAFNSGVGAGGAVTALFVNQFGFTRERLGDAAPEGLTISDLRRAADVELGLSTYEPFGIAPLEPLHAGAICVVSSVSGCMGLARRALPEVGIAPADAHVLLEADFTDHAGDHPAGVGVEQRTALEEQTCRVLAEELARRLARTDAERARLLEQGQRIAARMSWHRVAETDILPALREAHARPA